MRLSVLGESPVKATPPAILDVVRSSLSMPSIQTFRLVPESLIFTALAEDGV